MPAHRARPVCLAAGSPEDSPAHSRVRAPGTGFLAARNWLRRIWLLLVSVACSACATHLPPVSRPFTRSLTLDARRLTLHLANRDSTGKRPLLVYTTGDGGWGRKDLALYQEIVAWGYPTAGFSAPDYLDHLRDESGTTTPERLGRDYADIIAFAETSLGVEPGTPVVLIGVSRGAGLEVVAAGQPRVRDKLTGVVAVALTREEEYVRWYGRLPVLHHTQKPVMVQVYEYLPLLGSLPIAVIQSTHDQFLSAPAAAQLFGADTPTRRFHPIDARNHSFAGARGEMYQAVRDALDWIMSREPRAATP